MERQVLLALGVLLIARHFYFADEVNPTPNNNQHDEQDKQHQHLQQEEEEEEELGPQVVKVSFCQG